MTPEMTDGEGDIVPILADGEDGDLEDMAVPETIPVLSLKNTVLFPGVVLPISIGRPKSVQLIKDSYRTDKIVGTVAQKDPEVENPGFADLHTIGTIGQIVKLTNRARSEGLLALEDEAKSIEDPFFRKGIEFAVDGTDPEALKKTLLSEISALRERHKVGQGWCTQAGVFAPTFGIIGAVFGLMATMANLSKPTEVGAGIAGAFVATFWGVFLANAIFLPFANKLKQLSSEEVAHKLLIVEGIMAIQAGVSPRVVEELLKSHVPPAEREEVVVTPTASEAPAAAEAA